MLKDNNNANIEKFRTDRRAKDEKARHKKKILYCKSNNSGSLGQEILQFKTRYKPITIININIIFRTNIKTSQTDIRIK